MSSTFASPEWAAELATRLRDDARVRTESVTWVHGPLALVVDPETPDGTATALRIDLHEGSVGDVDVMEPGAVRLVPFAFGAPVARWQSIVGGELTIYDGILQGGLRARGDLPTV